jgi:hypothetical protein
MGMADAIRRHGDHTGIAVCFEIGVTGKRVAVDERR